jgi:hypothetical protein
MQLSTQEAAVRKREKGIVFAQFLRPRHGTIRPSDMEMLRQPDPRPMPRHNLLQTFGCYPGPGIGINASKIARSIQ